MAVTLTIGSLFSGIGGLELGLEWAGLGPIVFQCEVDAFCRAVLGKHWPHVTRFEDVTQPRSWPYVDLVCGGFPCQDVSSAGKRRGLGGQRSGLWYHFARVVEQIAPRFVVVENVASGQKAWLPHVRHGLHLLGYRTRALGISARDVGAPHLRERLFVIAYADGRLLRHKLERQSARRAHELSRQGQAELGNDGPTWALADHDARGRAARRPGPSEAKERRDAGASGQSLGDAASARRSGDSGGSLKQRSRALPNQAGGPLNPTWVEWLMGFPVDWTDGVAAPACARSATRSSRSARKSSAKSSNK